MNLHDGEPAGNESSRVVDAGCRSASSPTDDTTRRTFLRRGGKLLLYTAPLVQLFDPHAAMASAYYPGPQMTGL